MFEPNLLIVCYFTMFWHYKHLNWSIQIPRTPAYCHIGLMHLIFFSCDIPMKDNFKYGNPLVEIPLFLKRGSGCNVYSPRKIAKCIRPIAVKLRAQHLFLLSWLKINCNTLGKIIGQFLDFFIYFLSKFFFSLKIENDFPILTKNTHLRRKKILKI